MLRVICVLSIVGGAFDCFLAALGAKEGVFIPSFAWLYWPMAASLIWCAVEVARKGTE